MPILHQSFLPTTGTVDAYAWKYSHEYGGRRPRHIHAEPELNFVVSGWAEFGVGEATVRVSKGEIVGFPAGQDHVLLASSPDVFLFAVGMSPRLATDALGGPAGESSVPLYLRPKRSELASLTRRAEQLVEQSGVEHSCAEFWEHVHWLGQHRPMGRSGALHALTKRALRALAESPELELQAIARDARANASELSRYFHRDMGMKLVQYRTRLRILRFISLAEAPDGTLSTAAVAAGFGSYSQCHRTFTSELGCSPRTFLKGGVKQEMQFIYED